MEKLKSKLFEDLKLKNAEVVKVIGGKSAYTEKGSDTSISSGGYDIVYNTHHQGGTVTPDSAVSDPTNETNLDKPL